MTLEDLDIEEQERIKKQIRAFAREHGLPEDDREVLRERMSLICEAVERYQSRLADERKKEIQENPDAVLETVRAFVGRVTKKEYLESRDIIFKLVEIGELPEVVKKSYTKNAAGMENYILLIMRDTGYWQAMVDMGMGQELQEILDNHVLPMFPSNRRGKRNERQ